MSEGPTHRFVAVENVIVTLYWGMSDADSLQRRLPWAERVVETYGSLGQLVVADPSAEWSMPSPEWREVSRAHSKRFQSVVDFTSIVLEPDDVKSALLRTLARGLTFTLSLDRRIKLKVFDDLHSGTSYAERHGRVSALRLSELVRCIRPGRDITDIPRFAH